MLDDAIKAQLAAYLEKVQHPIELIASLDASDAAHEMHTLLADIAALSPKVSVREGGDAQRRPSFGIAKAGEAPRVHFAGLPMGHEFTTLVLGLLQVGGHPPKISDEVVAQIRALPAGLRFETYISLSCHNCPDVIQALNTLAVLNPGISSTMIDGALFQTEVDARGIKAVPAVYQAGDLFGAGRMSLEEMIAKLDVNAGAAEAERLNAEAPFDVLIVGGGPAGASAAIYAARKGIRTGIVAERFGGQLLDTVAIENFISVKRTEGPHLATALEEHVKQYGVTIMTNQRAAELIPGSELHQLKLAGGATLSAKTVILATGASWREMKIPGESEYRTKGVTFCPHCDGPLFAGKRVAVVGGGNSGIEAAIDLAGVVAHVTVLEFDSKLRADAVLQQKLHSMPNTQVILNAQSTEVVGDGKEVTGLVYTDRVSGESKTVDLEGIFVQIGLLPNTTFLKNTIALSQYGEIEIDARGQTSVPGVFAAGDCTTVPYKQIVIAMGEGTKASLSAFDHLIRSPVPAAVEPA